MCYLFKCKHLLLFYLLLNLNACWYDGDCLYGPQAVYCGVQVSKKEILDSFENKSVDDNQKAKDIKVCTQKTRRDINGYGAFVHCMEEKGYEEVR